MTLATDPASCLARAHRALDGLSVGDGFGATFFPVERRADLAARRLSAVLPWPWTDDTAMALELVAELAERGDVDEAALAARFARRYALEPWRGYGRTARTILTAMAGGTPWEDAARAPFDGTGSKGNGGAMRVAPLGAYFAHDLGAVVAVARRSARPTHLHLDGEAGTIAIAVAAALLARAAAGLGSLDGPGLLAAMIAYTPASATRAGLEVAAGLPAHTAAIAAAARLGNGAREMSEDTVPLCGWLIARHLGAYEAALWETATALGDIDTNCAIVGGVLAAGGAAIPPAWLAAREALPS